MKRVMIQILVSIIRFVNIIFYPLSLKEKVCIISRQANEPTLDIKLLNEQLKKKNVKTVVLTKMLNKTVPGVLSYGLQMIKQMYYIATSRVIVLDGYCILVSILPKKKNQQVVQMWHALGAIKKFGWQNVENPDGHGHDIAEVMCMHRNYDYVLAPGKLNGEYFAEAFRMSQEQVIYCGLPRIDFLKHDDVELKEQMQKLYPEILRKKNVLYVPTFRKNAVVELERLIERFDFEQYNLIIKKHFLDKGDYTWAKESGAIIDEIYTSMQWLRIVEKVVTDYSAMAFEAAILKKELYIFQPDVEEYEQNVGLNIELKNEAIAKYVFKDEQQLVDELKTSYEKTKIIEFLHKYIEVDTDNCTEQLCNFLSKLLVR